FYPTFTMAFEQSKYAGGGINSQWFDTLTWMRTNTPDQEFYDQYYYQVYEPNQEGEYPYPQETYGVMSWWDYGHWIETIAHRIPNANPFQQGIGKKDSSDLEQHLSSLHSTNPMPTTYPTS
ncbi:MAG: hypothetical protein R6U44_06340, partial [Archaeoglobaceae archaeon]